MQKITYRTFSYILLSLLLSGCSSMAFRDFFASYTQQLNATHLAQQQGHFKQAEQLLPKRTRFDGNFGLLALESGRLEYLASDWSASQHKFEQAYLQVKEQQEQAQIQISRGVENLGALVSNDNALRYDIPLYEQSMLHSYQALNFVYQRQLESALVEVRRANLVQEQALKNNQAQLAQAKEKMANNGVSTRSLSNNYPSMSAIIGDVKNGFQNAYTFYLSGLLYEAAGELNDAYIDYKKALEISPNNQYLQQDVLRLATLLVMSHDLPRLEKRFGKYQAAAKNTGQLVIVMEQGMISPKQSVDINLPVFTSRDELRYYSVALPVYSENKQQKPSLVLSVNQQEYQSQPIVKLHALAAKQLEEQLPAIVTRQVLRVVSKEELRQQLSRKGGEAGNILATLYNVASENADTRSWTTLPENIDIIRLNLSQGQHQLQLNYAGKQETLTVDIRANAISLLNYTALGNYTGYQAVNL